VGRGGGEGGLSPSTDAAVESYRPLPTEAHIVCGFYEFEGWKEGVLGGEAIALYRQR
jgi:hypothetical protein